MKTLIAFKIHQSIFKQHMKYGQTDGHFYTTSVKRQMYENPFNCFYDCLCLSS